MLNHVEFMLTPKYQLISELGYRQHFILNNEIGCLVHFLLSSVRALQALIEQSVATCKLILSAAAQKAICITVHIFSM